MSEFYCRECGDILDDPDEDTCAFCRVNEEEFCDECGSPIPFGGDCEVCQEFLDSDILDEDDEEFLRGPFGN